MADLIECPRCKYKPILCEVGGCEMPAYYEGWWRVKDFSGTPTGLMQVRRVCEDHKDCLIGGK